MRPPPIEEYAATATRVEAQDSYLPPFSTRASHPNSLSTCHKRLALISLAQKLARKAERIGADERGARTYARRSRGRATLQGGSLRVTLQRGDKGPRPSKL